jgi:uncharacterized protein (TIGR02145 family)
VTTNDKIGNAVVKIYRTDNNNIIWSYHIWVTDPDAIQTWENTNHPAGKYIFMDRNLGATEAANSLKGRGLLYQWGRKDPFPGGKAGMAGYAELASKFEGMSGSKDTGTKTVSSSDVDGAIIESIQNPARFYCTKINGDWLPALQNDLWNSAAGDKTIYDPCPEGWRVPVRSGTGSGNDYSPWKGFASTETEDKWGAWTSGSDTGGMKFNNDHNQEALYPASGYRADHNSSYSGGTAAMYWTGSMISSYTYTMKLWNDGEVNPSGQSLKASGFSVRCAQES